MGYCLVDMFGFWELHGTCFDKDTNSAGVGGVRNHVPEIGTRIIRLPTLG